jgi:GT2 family glycosyltransferase
MTKDKISAIIVTYNSGEDILNCIKSIYKEGGNIEVIVVDNNSRDNTIEKVKRSFSRVKTIKMSGNRGYAAGVNRGIGESSGKVLLIINPDSQVLPGALEAMIGILSKPDAGAVGPSLIDQKGVLDPNSHRYEIGWLVILFIVLGLAGKKLDIAPFRRYYRVKPSSDRIGRVGILSGSCMLVKRDVIAQVGGMDTSFFLFGEDVDFSLRIRKGGYKLYYQPRARVMHYVGHSRRSNPYQVLVEEVWSMARLAAKLDWGIVSRIAFALGILLLPAKYLKGQREKFGLRGSRVNRIGEMFRYLFLRMREFGFPWDKIHHKDYIVIKLGTSD